MQGMQLLDELDGLGVIQDPDHVGAAQLEFGPISAILKNLT
jgi:hypothetical protein